MSLAIRVDGLDKSYLRMAPGFRLRTLKSALLQRSLVGGHRAEDTILALEDVSFTVEKGTAYGVIGSNGSGKSTLLKCVAGITRPDRGQRRGRRPGCGPDRAGGRLPPRDLRPRERLYQRCRCWA